MINRSIVKQRVKFLLWISCSVLVASCWTKSRDKGDTKNEIVTNRQVDSTFLQIGSETISFVPDTLVLNYLTLRNHEAVFQFAPQFTGEKLVKNVRESPVFIFVNQDDTSYLFAYQYEGSTRYAFDCFEIGYIQDLEYKKEALKVDQAFFGLESGLKLRLSLEELIEIKGEKYTQEGKQIIYRINDGMHNPFLKQYNMPSYFLICTLVHDVITTIKFGFEQP